MSQLLRQANRKKAMRVKELMADPEWATQWAAKWLEGIAKRSSARRYPRPLSRIKSKR